jgi:GAF domain-containing protein
MERAAIFATQASIALENARLYQEMRDLQRYTGCDRRIDPAGYCRAGSRPA